MRGSWNVFGARTLSASGRQLFTIDRFRETGRPLLEVLADTSSIFIKGLAKFERRTLYASVWEGSFMSTRSNVEIETLLMTDQRSTIPLESRRRTHLQTSKTSNSIT